MNARTQRAVMTLLRALMGKGRLEEDIGDLQVLENEDWIIDDCPCSDLYVPTLTSALCSVQLPSAAFPTAIYSLALQNRLGQAFPALPHTPSRTATSPFVIFQDLVSLFH